MIIRNFYEGPMKEKLAQKIYCELELDIINGLYPINSKLPPERELAMKYDASRFAIREAIAMLINAGLAETKPQSGTFIKDFYHETSLDSLIKILRASNSIDIRTFQSFVDFKTVNDVTNAGRAAENITADSLKKIETLILKKKMNNDPQILAECDFNIYFEIIKASHDPINFAITVSLKPVRLMTIKLLYTLENYKDRIIENDIQLFKALSAHDSEEAKTVMKEKLHIFKDAIMHNARIEDGKIYFHKLDELIRNGE